MLTEKIFKIIILLGAIIDGLFGWVFLGYKN